MPHKKGVSVANDTLSNQLQVSKQMFPGPKFGIQGLRDILGISHAPL
jgi:ribulose 1,5-bisphosphate carboxylase large subunit-like protein